MKEKINIAIFILALALLIVFVLVLPPDPEAPDYENRSMTGMPVLSAESLLDGSYCEGVEAHLGDAVAYRTSILQFAAEMEQNYGFRRSGDAILVEMSGDDMGLGLIPETEDEDLYIPLPPPAVAPETAPSEEIDVPVDGTDTTTDSSGMQVDPSGNANGEQTDLSGTPGRETAYDDETSAQAADEESPSPTAGHVDPSRPFGVDIDYDEDAVLYERYRESGRAARRYADILNSYMSRMPENVRVFSMLAPIRVEFMGERYASSNDSQRDTIDMIYDLLDERIIRTATYEMLAAHKDEYIYFRTDHHWTALGAYYAYLSFAEAAGFAPIDISNYIERSIPGFLGSYGRGSSDRNVREHPDTLYYYELDNGTAFTRNLFVVPEDLSRLSYRVFMGGDYGKLDYTSSNTNGRTLVVVKDSFANALIPWLSPHYERIIVIDPRHHGGSVTRLLAEFEDADLLFMNYVAATAMSDFIETIYSVR